MKSIKFLLLGIILTIAVFGISNIQAQTSSPYVVKPLQITISQSGGFAGISRAMVLDNDGNFTSSNRAIKTTEKVSDEDIREVRDLVNDLKLETAKLKTVKGQHIYDGIYNSFAINFDGKLYLLEGNNFDDQQFVDLTAEQKKTADKLRAKIEEIAGKLPEQSVN